MEDATLARPPEETPTVHLSAMTPQPAQLAPGAVLGGRYRIVSLIGQGGMGAVYRGDDLRLGQPIAMKFLNRRTSESRERLLYDEVRIGRQISHPNVCRLYDIAEVDGQIFITMEFVDGEDLSSLLRRIGRLPHDKAVSVARDLCAGLAAAHEMGVIHRDLKPGNVMLDGRGRARITDFGLAVAETAREQAAAGTPAYMAPEQLAGGRATVQSDIYALGLVLYELFTGKRVFSGSTLTEILEQQRAAKIVPPKELVPEIDPRIERTILRCLDPDPAARPESVPLLLRELPSFDPLAAAVAAGETPSPAMVAAAAEKGELSPAIAWGVLATALLALALTVALSKTTKSIGGMRDIKPPDVLLERARGILAGAGLTTPPRDSGWYYLADAQQRRAPVVFVYRQSPRSMESKHRERILTAADPPVVDSGMVSMTLDGSGRLIELTIAPPELDSSPRRTAADFSALLDSARVDRSRLVPAAPAWAAPVDSDFKQAWLIRGTERRIEAAAYHGRPVWFAVIEPWQKPLRMTPAVRERTQRIADGTLITLLIALPAIVLFIALRNLRRGQGDHRGGRRVALFVLASLFGSGLLRAHHVPEFGTEWILVSKVVVETVFWSGTMWMAYIALEPLVRRRWPRMLIGWTRLVEGRWRDPMVGRDLLAGTAFGALITLSAHATVFLGGEPLVGAITPIGSTRQTLFFLAFQPAVAVGRALFAAVLVLILRAVVRRLDVAVTLSAVLVALGALDIPGGPLAVRVAWALVVGAVAYFILFRFGLLALASSALVILLTRDMPLTSDPSLFWFGRSTLVVGFIAAMALFGFWRALGGKSPLPRLAVD